MSIWRNMLKHIPNQTPTCNSKQWNGEQPEILAFKMHSFSMVGWIKVSSCEIQAFTSTAAPLRFTCFYQNNLISKENNSVGENNLTLLCAAHSYVPLLYFLINSHFVFESLRNPRCPLKQTYTRWIQVNIATSIDFLGPLYRWTNGTKSFSIQECNKVATLVCFV